jgi:uncharacterized protein DUF4389
MQNYPANLKIDYSEKSNCLTSFFRIFLVIPILIILALLTSEMHDKKEFSEDDKNVYSVGIVFLPTMFMIVFRQKYPKWWYNWNLELTKFSTRVCAYALLLRDDYPSTDEEQAVHITIPYPDAKENLNRWLPLIKWFLVIPHIIVLCFLFIGVIFSTIYVWFFILFAGRYPKVFFDFVVGFIRWSIRVSAYALILTTDEYPPFRLGE